MPRRPAVYIVTNRRNGTLYTGVTADLPRRMEQHRHGHTPGFASRHGCKLLVYYAFYDLMVDAILEEKRIKGGSRLAKLALIEGMNPDWDDLYGHF